MSDCGPVLHWAYRVDHGAIIIGGVHDGGDCFHPLGLIGDEKSVGMIVFQHQEALRVFIQQIAAISVALDQQAVLREGLQVAEVMAEVDGMFNET